MEDYLAICLALATIFYMLLFMIPLLMLNFPIFENKRQPIVNIFDRSGYFLRHLNLILSAHGQ